jgi:predicted nucleic acid-binding protein
MAVIDASVYVALVNAHEREHTSSWAWFEQTRAADESVIAPVILLAEVAAALSRGTGDPTLAHRVV